MNLKMLVVFLSILILLFGIFSVSASDNAGISNDNLTNIKSNTYDDLKVDNDNQKLSNFEDKKLNAGNDYTFDDLQSKIDAAYAGGELNLDAGDLYVNTNSKTITISQTLTINGNGATISGATNFTVSGTNVVLKNIKYINSRSITWKGDNGVIGDCTFVNNAAENSGGSVYWNGVNGVLGNCSFVNNTASRSGGAVYWSAVNGTLSYCSFINSLSNMNYASYAGGGAVYWYGVGGVLGNCSFVNNTVSSNVNGGAVYWWGSSGVLDNCSFVNHLGVSYGSVWWNGVNGTLSNSYFFNNSADSAGALFWSGVNGTLSNCSFVNNTAISYGGAVYWFGAYGVLSNCTFINSSINNPTSYLDCGGSAVYWHGGGGVLGNCSFVNNTASRNGGAVYWRGSTGVLGNCSFVNNTALSFGAAIYWWGSSGVLGNCSFVNNNGSSSGSIVFWFGSYGVLGNCSFVNNTALGHGGGVYWSGTNGTLSNCSFVNNTATYGGGAVYWNARYGVLGNCSFVNNKQFGTTYGGGAVYWYAIYGVLGNCSFVDNTALGSGGGVYWSGRYGVLGNCSFVNNEGRYGGGVHWYLDGVNGTLSNCSFVNNVAKNTYGGGVYWFASNGTLSNCSFINNVAASYGGGVQWSGDYGTLSNCSFRNNVGQSDGGGVSWSGSYGVLSNCSFVNNNANTGRGGAINWGGGYIGGYVRNCTFVNNRAGNLGCVIYASMGIFMINCYVNGDSYNQAVYLRANSNISSCRFDRTKIYIYSNAVVRFIDNLELEASSPIITNDGELFLSGNDLKSYILNNAKITSPVTMIALNNQTVKPSSNKIDITASIYNDDNNIIRDNALRICVGSTVYTASFDGVNYTASGCDVPENKSVVSVKINRANNYTDITFKNGLLLQPPKNFTVDVGFNVVGNDVLMLFNVTPTTFNDNLTVFVANKEYSVKITDGRGNVSVRNLPADSYVMLVYYPENDEYNSYLHSFNFTVNLLPSQIYISVGDYYAGSDVIIGVNLTSGASGLPIIYVDNKKVDYTALGNINLGKLAYGNHTVSVIYASDKYYDSSFNMTDFFVKKNNSTISLNITDGSGDTSKNIIVEVTNGATGDVLIDVNGVVYRKSLSASKTTLVLDDLKNGTYNVVVTYLGDEIYNSNSTSGSFEINATAPGNLTVNVTVIIDGKNYTGVIVDGVYHVDLSNATPGIYNATVIYRDCNNNLINTTMIFAVPKWDSNVDVKVFNIRMGEIETVVVNVTRGATGTVLIDVNGTAYYKILDNSRAELVLSNLNAGNYPVRVIYMGDDKYNNSTNRAEFIVGEGVVVSVFMDGKNPMLDVIVPEDAVGSVTVTINNKDYTGVINNRHAIINISDVAPNTYNITTSYTNTSGATVKGNATITVPKALLIATVINVEYVSKDLMVTSVLKDINGNVLANEEITYSMNGVIGKTTTDRDGLFKVKYVSNSTLYIEYGGNNVYEGSNTTIVLDKFVDLRNATKIISEEYDTYAVDFDLGERGGYFKFRLVDDNGNPLANKPVQIGFCGVVYNRVTDSEGNAQLQINLNTPFIFTFAIAFLGDDTHNASFVVQQINVVKKTTSVSAASKSYKASEKTKKFTVTLKSDKCSSIDGNSYLGMGKKITLKVNGKTYSAKTNMRNQATFKLSISKKGTYNVEIKFEGDQRYAASKTTAKIKII